MTPKFITDIHLSQKTWQKSNFSYNSPNLVFPVRNSVHPFPDITKWDPEDYYDVT